MKRLFSRGCAGCSCVVLGMMSASVALPAGARAATVALFYDANYVEINESYGAEGYVISNALAGLGHTVNAFAGIGDADFSSALVGADVLVIPDLEVGDLSVAMGPAAQAVIAGYVATGGGLIQHGGAGYSTTWTVHLLNSVFGFSIVHGTSRSDPAVCALTSASDTAFEGGPASLPGQPSGDVGTVDTSTLPPGSVAVYENLFVPGETWVGLVPYGQGRVVWLGWDWFDGVPVGPADGGWLEVLDRAIEEAIHPLRIVDVATGSTEVHVTHTADAGEQYTVEYSDGPLANAFSWKPFANPVMGGHLETAVLGTIHTFVDDFTALTSGGPSAGGHRYYRVRTGAPDAVKKIALFFDANYTPVTREAENTLYGLQAAGHNVVPFDGTAQEQWAAALDGADVLVIPELEYGGLSGALSLQAKSVVSNFVAGGGCMIVHGVYDSTDETLLNSIFGYALVHGSYSGSGFMLAGLTNETGSAFAGGPATVPDLSGTSTWQINSLPPGSRSFYQGFSTNETWVAWIPEGRGSIVFLGWDWYNAPPQGSQDGGWLEVQERAIQQCCRKKVGYYDMVDGQGDATQILPILTAGHDPVDVLDLSPAELASVDVLFVQSADNFTYAAEYVSRVPEIETAVSNGMVLVLNDRAAYGGSAQTPTVVPGASGIVFSSLQTGDDIQVAAPDNLVIDGPGGTVTDTTLDGGGASSHGFATSASLPTGTVSILSRAAPGEVVLFAYPYGTGWVVYSTIPLDFYLGGSGPASFRNVYAPNVVAFGASLAD